MALAVYIVRLAVAIAEAYLIKLRMAAKQQALNLLNQVETETDELENQIAAYRRIGNANADRMADRLLERYGRRSALRSSVTAGLPILEGWTNLPSKGSGEVVQSSSPSGERPANS